MPDVVTCLLVHLLIGSLIWMVMNPVAYTDFVHRRWAQRGSSPTAAILVLAHMVAIVLWPKTVWKFAVALLRWVR